MEYSVDESDTLYAIKFRLDQTIKEVQIGKLGEFNFSSGYYVYVGSAKRNITARVERHLQVDKKKRWHLDYLRPYLSVESVQSYAEEEGECALFRRLKAAHKGSIPIKGFGSSDCQCPAHLFYIEVK